MPSRLHARLMLDDLTDAGQPCWPKTVVGDPAAELAAGRR